MFTQLNALQTLFQRCPPNPAVAAAVVVLASLPPSPNSGWLDRALHAVAPRLAGNEHAAWVAALAEPLRRASIDTPRSLAAFLGQCAVESAGFQSLEEDLNYSAARLCQVWPARFPTAETAATCARQPETLANRVYASRMGNDDEASGDGWRFRGRGLIQLTGRANYALFARAMAMTLDQAVGHATTTAGAADSAAWFWSSNQLNAAAETWSLDLITHKINSGMAGAAERTRLCEAALHAIGT